MSAPVVSMLVMVLPMPFSAWDSGRVASECAIVAFMAWITSFLPPGVECPTYNSCHMNLTARIVGRPPGKPVTATPGN